MAKIGAMLALMFGGFPQALIAIMGTLLLAVAIMLTRRAMRISRGHVAVGRIVRYVENRDSESTTTYAPVFRFRPGASAEIEVQSQTRFDRAPDGIGDSLEVRYDVDRPERADVTSTFKQMLGVAVIFMLAAGCFYTAWDIAAS